MIRCDHCIIRSADPDDAAAFKALYDPECPRAALLTRLREPVYPTLDESREMLVQAEKTIGGFFAVEDLEGRIRAFAALRSSQQLRETTFYAEAMLSMADAADYAEPIAEEALEWLLRRAFAEQRLNKVVAHCLDTETALRERLAARGFASNGVQRDVTFTLGRYVPVETLSFHARQFADAAAEVDAPCP